MLLADTERCLSRTMPAPCSKGILGFPNSEQYACIAMALKVTKFDTHRTSFGRIWKRRPPTSTPNSIIGSAQSIGAA